MRTRYRLLIILAFLASNHLFDGGPFDLLVCFAQSTQVTGTVKDVNGIPYAGGQIKAQLVLNGAGVTGQPVVTVNNTQQCISAGQGSAPCKVGFNGTQGPLALDPTGSFSISLQDNSLVTPSGTQWLFTVTSTGVPPPLGTGPQTCSATVTITGASQSVSPSFSACPALSATGGGGGVGNGAAPQPRFYLAPQCPVADSGQCFFTPANTQQVVDCGWTAATPSTVTCASSHFTAGDVGKQVMGWGNCLADQTAAFMGVNAIATTGSPTITSFISATSVQISTAANAQAAQTGCFIWGTPDDANAVLVEAAYDVATFCPGLDLIAANYWFNNFHFNSQPTACSNAGVIAGLQFGNVFYPAGFELKGQGTGNTVLYLGTNFPTGAVAGACANTNAGSGGVMPSDICFAVPPLGHWRDFRIDGGDNAAAGTITAQTDLVGAIISSLDNVTISNWGNTNNVTACMALGYQDQLYQTNVTACGLGYRVLANQGAVSGFKVYSENSIGSASNASSGLQVEGPPGTSGAVLGYSFVCTYCGFYTNLPSGGGVTLVTSFNGSIVLRNTQLGPILSGSATSAGYTCRATPGCLLILKDSQVKTSLVTTNIGLRDSVAGTMILQNVTVTPGATGPWYTGVSGSKFYSEGGNTLTGSTTVNAGGLFMTNPTDNLSGVTSGITPTCAATTGGTACSVLAGSTNEKGTIRITASAVATGTVTLTFVGTFTGPTGTTPRGEFSYVNAGGTGAWSLTTTTPIVLTTRSSTAPVINWNQTGNLTAGNTYDIDYAFQAQ